MKAKALLLVSIACSLATAQITSRSLLQQTKTKNNKGNRKLLGGCTIFVRDDTGVQQAVDVEPGAQVKDIRTASGVPANVPLTFAGNELKDGEAFLSDIGIGAEAVVNVVYDNIVSKVKAFEENSPTLLWLLFINDSKYSDDSTADVAIQWCAQDDTLMEITKHVIEKHYEELADEIQGKEYEIGRKVPDGESWTIDRDGGHGETKLSECKHGEAVRVYYK